MKTRIPAAILCSLLFGSAVAHADEDAITGIYVEFWNGSAWVNHPNFPNRSANQSGLAYGSNVNIPDANDLTYRCFAVDPGQSIGNVAIAASTGNGQPRLLIGIGLTNVSSSAPLSTPGAASIGTISYGLGKPRIQANITNGFSSVSAWEIVRLDTQGAISGTITHNPTADANGPTLGYIKAQSISGNVTAWGGNIGTVDVSSSISGLIASNQGFIGIVKGPTPTSHPIITSTAVIESGGVDSNGNNMTEVHCSSFAGLLRKYGGSQPQYAKVGTFDVASTDFSGTAHLAGFTTFTINRDLSGTINFSPSFPEDKRLTIGRSLASTGVINVPAEAMLGQVFINKNNAASPNVGTWAGAFNVGGVPLANAPYYTNTFADIGGGAVGLATFHLHEESCLPPHNSVMALHVGPTCLLEGDPTCLDLLTCVTVPEAAGLEFYGPLADLAANNAPIDAAQALVVKVRALVSNPTPWGSVPDTASDYKIQLEGTGTDADRRTLVLTRDDDGPLGVDAEFQVSLKSGQTALKSFGVTSTPTVGTFTYQFAIVFDCRGGLLEVFDMNEDGILNYADIYAWLLENEDFDGDGPDPEDLATLINAILAYQAGA